MVNQDPIADLISRLKNSTMAGKREFSVPYSNFKKEILQFLVKEGFIKSFFENKENGIFKELEVEITGIDEPFKIKGIEKISKNSRREYKGFRDIFPQKAKVSMFSTPKGVMTSKEARAKKIGGEEILKVW